METVLRGYHGKDAVQFGPKWEAKLNAAIQELFFLLNRGYDVKSASTFIGNHYLLSERQRPETALQSRRAKELLQPPESLALDGFNTIITLEVALSGSLLLLGMDGTIRDLAGLRGTYRIVDKTEKAVRLLLSRLEALKVREAVFYLDQQVSNSGRLRGLLLELGVEYSTEIRAELHPCVDGLLSPMEGVVTSDAIILDKCGSWYNLNRDIVTRSIPNAWLFRPSFPNQ